MVRPTFFLGVLAAATLGTGACAFAGEGSRGLRGLGGLSRNLAAVISYSDWVCNDSTGKKTRTRIVNGNPLGSEQKNCDPVDCVLYTQATDPGAWGPCTEEATGWFKSKTLQVQSPPKYGGAACPTTVVKEYCPPVNCVINTPTEETVPFGACQDDVDAWYKHRTLGIKTAAQYGGACPGPTDPSRDDTEYCPPVDCVINQPSEESAPFGSCQDDGLAGWNKHRTLGVKTAAQYGGTCPATTDPSRDDTESCPPVNCVINQPSEESAPFGSCQDDGAAGWNKHRILGIKTAAQYGGTCPATTDPSRDDTESCPPVNCVINQPSEESAPFGSCQDDGAAGWNKHRILGIKTAAQYGGTCPATTDPSRDDKEFCPPVGCVINQPSEESAPFGSCQDDGLGGWNKHRTLGVKTAAQYGGTCPPTTDPSRDDTEFCPPINCVVKTSAEDTGPFAACVQEAGGWYKHKTLGIKTDEQYGGSCPGPSDVSRAYKEVCPPVACVVNTEAEDTGAYGACQQGSDGWYKYKSLAIKTAALYGGTCPTKVQRRVSAPCSRSCQALSGAKATGYKILSATIYDAQTAADSAACCTLCLADVRCESFTYFDSNDKCVLQSAKIRPVVAVDATAGTILSV